jgi:hypothetical protein
MRSLYHRVWEQFSLFPDSAVIDSPNPMGDPPALPEDILIEAPVELGLCIGYEL